MITDFQPAAAGSFRTVEDHQEPLQTCPMTHIQGGVKPKIV